LLAAQLALVIVLLIGAAVATLSLWRLVSRPVGFALDHTLVADVSPPASIVGSPDRYFEFIASLRRSAGAVPGVSAVTVAADAPLGPLARQRAELLSRPIFPAVERVSDGYLEALGAQLVAGRDLQRTDALDDGAVLVDESFAKRFFGSPALALGQFVRLGSNRLPSRIVGVAPDIQQAPLFVPPSTSMAGTVYAPFGQGQAHAGRIVVMARVQDTSAGVVNAFRGALEQTQGNMFVNAYALATRFSQQSANARLAAFLLLAIGSFTLLLACSGIYATISQLTIDRYRELAVRAALGATGGRLIWTVASQAWTPIGSGAVLGLGLGYGLVGNLKTVLFETTVHDSFGWSAAVATVVLVAAIAAVVPAMQAAAISPGLALKGD
jgi:ABC-type antimicrobial peptide transport system permease subunit